MIYWILYRDLANDNGDSSEYKCFNKVKENTYLSSIRNSKEFWKTVRLHKYKQYKEIFCRQNSQE